MGPYRSILTITNINDFNTKPYPLYKYIIIMKKHFIFLGFLALIVVMLSTSCQPETTKTIAIPGIDLSLMDTTVAPQQDFYRYVNGKWLQNTEIPSDRTRWGSFDELRKKSSENVLKVLEAAIASGKYKKGTDQYKAAAFYSSAMDTTAIDKMGIEPVKGYLDKIAAIKSIADIQKYNEETIYLGSRGFFDFAVFADLKNSSMNAAYISSGSIGLPERDYYTNQDEESQKTRQDYLDHIVIMYQFLGVKEEAKAKAETILAIETRLAEAMMTKEESRNPLLLYNKRSLAELQEKVPMINWKSFVKNIGAGEMDTILVLQPKYIESLASTMKDFSIDELKDYMTWTEFNNVASFLSSDVEKAKFDFYGKTLRGAEEMTPRWERILNVSSGVVGEAIGKLYVDEYFPEEAKAKASEMVSNIKEAMGDRINGLDWMTPDTKVKAIEKLNAFTVKIGYPDKWKDYSSMDIKSTEDGGSYASNMIAASKWSFEEQLADLGKEVDKTEWGMSPQTVNAYYNPLNNEIVFPAAILQPPFYNYQADEAVNYGGIGAVIGHEISHGFDDQGSRFDAKGNMENWWTDVDREQFDARNQKLIDQFNKFEPLPGVNVNGRFTLGENIGDLGGINVALDGLHKHFAKHGTPEPLDGFTPEQRFFVSWATIWRGKMRNEELINRIKTDPHSPGEYRAIGPISNLETFYNAFDVKPGDAMYRPDTSRVKIW